MRNTFNTILLFGLLACPGLTIAQNQTPSVQPSAAKQAQGSKLLPEEVPYNRLKLSQFRDLGDRFVNVESIVWSKDGKRLLVDGRRSSDKRYEVKIIPVDVNAPVINISEGRTASGLYVNNGAPAWGPDEKGVIFVGQNTSTKDYTRSIPSTGQLCNLWYHDLENGSFYEVTQLQDSFSRPLGVTMPTFSPDGKLLFWTGSESDKEGSLLGQRALYLADWILQGKRPRLKNKRTIIPSENRTFFESYAVSPAGDRLLFAACFGKETPWYNMDICSMAVDGTDLKRLTDNPKIFNRYAAYSPRGKKITWSSSEGFDIAYMGIGGNRWQLELKSELWIMSANGKDKRQLTFFNQRGSQEYALVQGHRTFIGQSAWHPDGKHLAIVVNYDRSLSGGTLETMESRVFICELEEGR